MWHLRTSGARVWVTINQHRWSGHAGLMMRIWIADRTASNPGGRPMKASDYRWRLFNSEL